MELIDIVVEFLSPLMGGVAVVKELSLNRFAHDDAETFAPLGKHLARKQSHLKIETDAQFLAQIGQEIEAMAVSRLDKEGDYGAIVTYCFLDKCGFPLEVANLTVAASGTETRGEIEERVAGRKSRFEGFDIGAIVVDLVNGHKEGTESRESHKEIIDRELDILSPTADSGNHCHAVGAAQGMIASDDGAAFEGDVFLPFERDVDFQILFDKSVGKVQSLFVAVAINGRIELFDVQYTIEQAHQKARETDLFGGQNFLNINIMFRDRVRVDSLHITHRAIIYNLQKYVFFLN